MPSPRRGTRPRRQQADSPSSGLSVRPKAARVRGLNEEVCALATDVGTKTWQHHFCAVNRTANAAANIAMDLRANTQVEASDGRPEHNLI
ncbi:hypothetical protein PybrP1_000576 [[Pythium] brassicae (nom. inval.)]|nr:hypothetical protein PybrP1_000576 [[Pythium] brassicae (nom. inval.)]